MHDATGDSFSIDTEHVGRGAMAMQWFKMFAEFATDPKVQSMPETMQRRLVMLLCLHCNGDLEKLDDDELCLALRVAPKELEKTRDLFRRKGFIGDGWLPRNWDKRQQGSDRTAAERMRRYRERQREQQRDSNRNERNVTVHVTRNELRELEEEREDPPYSPPHGGTGGVTVPVSDDALKTPACKNTTTERPIATPSLTPELQALADRLEGGRPGEGWGPWLSQMCAAYEPPWVLAAMRATIGSPKFGKQYVNGVLQRYQRQGGPSPDGTPAADARPFDPPTPKIIRAGDPRS